MTEVENPQKTQELIKQKPLTEEEIINRRLIFNEGPMKKLFSNVLEFVSYSNGKPENEKELLHKTILDDLSDFEY